MFEDKTDLEIDESLKAWLRDIQLHRNMKDNPTVIDLKKVLKLLVDRFSAPVQEPLSKMSNYQLDPRRQIVKLFGKLRADVQLNSLARDVLRIMVLDSAYKTLVFNEWTQNLNRPENMLTFFIGSDFTKFLHNPLFIAWLNYVDWYWAKSKEQRLDRYITFIHLLQDYLNRNTIDDMLDSSTFIAVFPLNAGDEFEKEMQDAWKIRQVVPYNVDFNNMETYQKNCERSYLQIMTSRSGYFITSIPTDIMLYLTTTNCSTF
ncbi:uncharacterized protein PHALS_07547 [Plasmopara halstedii]|uniref:Uncharacterized protein n=1 Tax=Plasmopara halstedii TaxID=4781 RepID=A0A0P1B6F6_PLAHL|nr:uncharacterized protein PHALS_07547 [Plasmopara halstedii]CEG49804.1 hypothetical protein PHALS_07547 [Plasmopara halstedii]|eukprot:XP_024586173.1 hypothetical protein PHALS_07547 [Plasmopara halstedii]